MTFTDEKSGVDIEKCKWVLNNSDKNIGVDAGNYLGGSFTSEIQEIETGTITSANGGNMYIHILSVDTIGNTKEFISEAITIKTGYAISTPQDLQNMKNNLSASYYVVNDINMEGFSFNMILGKFTGTLDGQGHTISNFSIAKGGNGSGWAMFQEVAGNAKICNLLMKDVKISSQNTYGVGVFGADVVSYSTGKYNIVFEKVGITGSLTGQGGVASFIGEIADNEGSSITFRNCYARTDLKGSTGYDCSGLTLLGNRKNSAIVTAANCYWSGTNNGRARTGSLITPNTIENNNNQQIDSCISISNSYYDKEKFPLKIPAVESATGKGLLTEEMKKQESYAGWDFENIWHMGEDGYPELTFKEFK